MTFPGGEIFTSLQSGAIDAAEWVGPWNDLAFGFYQITKHYYYPGFHEPGRRSRRHEPGCLGQPLRQRPGVDPTLRASPKQLSLAEFDANNGDALDTLINEHGVQLHKFTDEILKAFGEAAGDVWPIRRQ